MYFLPFVQSVFLVPVKQADVFFKSGRYHRISPVHSISLHFPNWICKKTDRFKTRNDGPAGSVIQGTLHSKMQYPLCKIILLLCFPYENVPVCNSFTRSRIVPSIAPSFIRSIRQMNRLLSAKGQDDRGSRKIRRLCGSDRESTKIRSRKSQRAEKRAEQAHGKGRKCTRLLAGKQRQFTGSSAFPSESRRLQRRQHF